MESHLSEISKLVGECIDATTLLPDSRRILTIRTMLHAILDRVYQIRVELSRIKKEASG